MAANRAAWEDWSNVDPLWAIATAPDRRDGKWDEDEFFASGRATVDELWETASAFGLPGATRRALDFGCGVGRLTAALRRHVDEVLGLDISAGMVHHARSYHGGRPGVSFEVHTDADLHGYDTGSFDVVCCLLVLQHIPVAEVAEGYVTELVRVLAPGGLLMLQLIDAVPPAPRPRGLRARLRPRTRLAGVLRRAGVDAVTLRRRLGWEPPMALVPIPVGRAHQLVEGAGGRVVWERPRSDQGVDDRLYLVTR